MLYKKKGLPEEGDIALCTVTAIKGHSVFARMDEYKDLVGMIHVSEVSPGRIRNIRDFVKEGKTIICKVLKTYPDRGHVDLSLRRVSEGLRRTKLQQVKQEQTAEKIINPIDTGEEHPVIAADLSKCFIQYFIGFHRLQGNGRIFNTLGALVLKQVDQFAGLLPGPGHH